MTASPDEPDSYARFREPILKADGILFVTPEYNRGVPGVLKNAIDVGSRPVWQERVEPQTRGDRQRLAGRRSAGSAPITRSASRACSSTCR